VPAAAQVTPVGLVAELVPGVPLGNVQAWVAAAVPVFVKLKVFPFRHWLADEVKVEVTLPVSVTVVVAVAVQPFVSVTVTEYVPGARPVGFAPEPEGFHA
jgi:hypothetical protein